MKLPVPYAIFRLRVLQLSEELAAQKALARQMERAMEQVPWTEQYAGNKPKIGKCRKARHGRHGKARS